MALYRLKDSPYWWVSLVNPRTTQRIRRSTKLKNKKKAQLFEEQLLASMVLGEEHYALQENRRKPTWRQAADRWLDETQHKKDHVNDRAKLAWLDAQLGNKLLEEVSANLIHSVVDAKAKAASLATANRFLALISAILNRANKQWGWLETVPHIKFYKEVKRRVRYLSKEEAQRLLAELPIHLRDMALFSLSTGLRAFNVTALRWSQVDLKRKHIYIHGDQAKAGKAIAVPLNNIAVEVIVKQQGKHPSFVFTYKGEPVTRPNNHAWRKALKRAGITDFRWHDLRHTWAIQTRSST